MKRNIVMATAMILGMTAGASAERRATYKFSDPRGLGAPYTLPAPASVSHVIYLNRCAGAGCTLNAANYSDATTDTSSIPNGTSHISPYAGSDAQWNAIVSCVKQTYAPFNVTVTDQRPTSGGYHMAIVAGRASEAGQGSGVLGVSPFSCGYIPNSISFSFANEEASNINGICWTVSQETAHSWGLDHKFDNKDPMTYLASGPSLKAFQNQSGTCGEYQSRSCTCTYNGSTAAMNSYALIMQTFGSSAPDNSPPTVSFKSPNNNASIMPGFAVTANAADDIGITKVELRIDGTLTGTTTSAPFTFVTPSNLSQGGHHLELTAYDFSNNTTKAAEDVSYGQACTDGGCADASQVCVGGHCVAGPDSAGGLGQPCAGNSDCASNQCGDDGAGNKYCVEVCDPTSNSCPSGFGCLSESATAGVCWPGADNGGGSGCNTGGNNGIMLVGLGLGATLLTKRRRK